MASSIFERDELMRRLGPLYPAFVALCCLTCVPVPRALQLADEDLERSKLWLPVIGALVGALLALAGALLAALGLVPAVCAALLAVLGTVLTAGRFESGLARSLHLNRDPGQPWQLERMTVASVIAVLALIGLRAVALMGTAFETWRTALMLSNAIAAWVVLLLLTIGEPLANAPSPARYPSLIMATKATTGARPWPVFAIASGLVAALALILAGGLGLITMLAAAALAFAIGLHCQRRLGGLVHESVAAAAAVCELATLLIMAAAHPPVLSPWVG